jgi:hypothetical protein
MMRVLFTRTKMIGNSPACSYRAYVPIEDVARPDLRVSTRIISNGRTYASLVDAWQTDAHIALPRGGARWDSWKAHEARAQQNMLELARQHFPELNAIDTWPELWVEGVEAESAEAWDEVYDPR